MAWTYEDIERGWLAGSVIAVSPAQIVEAFDRCERVLGRDWIDRCRSVMTGGAPTLNVVSMGQRLACLDGVGGTEELIAHLRNGDASAHAELHAIHLLACDGQSEVELYPKVSVGTRNRVPDFRIRRDGTPWVHVEVARPDMSAVAERARAVASALAETVATIDRPIGLEVFLRREPTDDEIEALRTSIVAFSARDEAAREELPKGMGLLIRSEHPPGQIVATDHPGEEVCPRIGVARGVVIPNQTARHVMVRMPFSDQRAERFMSSEAEQLPRDAPGLIMVDMTAAQTGFKSWVPLIQRRLQPTIHTRVGGVCLFTAGIVLTADGLGSLSETNLLLNPHARLPLPSWVEGAIVAAGSEFKRVMEEKANQ